MSHYTPGDVINYDYTHHLTCELDDYDCDTLNNITNPTERATELKKILQERVDSDPSRHAPTLTVQN